jgi:hypothetical protein
MDRPNGPWFDCLPECETRVPCGAGWHTLHWEAGVIRLPAHPDPEAELVLAALGGEKARCLDVAQAWERHTADLSMLSIGSHGPADQTRVSWDDVLALPGPGTPGFLASAQAAGVAGLASQSPSLAARATAGRRQKLMESDQARLRRSDILSLLALGYGFQIRLAGQVAMSHAERLDDPAGRAAWAARPALVAALTGRLARLGEEWLGIEPGQVVASLHTGPGWGSTELTGRGAERRLRVSLPAGWLARVWACGLALTGRHLVVAVERAGWPDARVLGVPAPGAEPVPLDVHAREGEADAPHWEV